MVKQILKVHIFAWENTANTSRVESLPNSWVLVFYSSAICVCVEIYMYVCVYLLACVCMYIYVCVCMYIYTHTHIWWWWFRLSTPHFSMGSLGDRSPVLLPGHLHRNHCDFHTAPSWSEALLYRVVWLHGTFWFVINSAGFCATARGENCFFGEIYCESQTVLKLLERNSILDANILFFVLWNFTAVKG